MQDMYSQVRRSPFCAFTRPSLAVSFKFIKTIFQRTDRPSVASPLPPCSEPTESSCDQPLCQIASPMLPNFSFSDSHGSFCSFPPTRWKVLGLWEELDGLCSVVPSSSLHDSSASISYTGVLHLPSFSRWCASSTSRLCGLIFLLLFHSNMNTINSSRTQKIVPTANPAIVGFDSCLVGPDFEVTVTVVAASEEATLVKADDGDEVTVDPAAASCVLMLAMILTDVLVNSVPLVTTYCADHWLGHRYFVFA